MELILVVIAIAFFTSFAIPQYNGVITNARQKSARIQLSVMQSAQEIFFSDNGYYYPSSGTADVSSINSHLNIAVTEDDMKFQCTASGSTFQCTAKYPKTGTAVWTCTATQSSSEPTC